MGTLVHPAVCMRPCVSTCRLLMNGEARTCINVRAVCVHHVCGRSAPILRLFLCVNSFPLLSRSLQVSRDLALEIVQDFRLSRSRAQTYGSDAMNFLQTKNAAIDPECAMSRLEWNDKALKCSCVHCSYRASVAFVPLLNNPATGRKSSVRTKIVIQLPLFEKMCGVACCHHPIVHNLATNLAWQWRVCANSPQPGNANVTFDYYSVPNVAFAFAFPRLRAVCSNSPVVV